MCPKHIPSSHFIPALHPSHVLKFISLYLSTLVSPHPSLHLAYLSAALLAQWQSHHTLSIRLVRPGRSAAQHRTVLVWSHQCQSVSLTLSVTLKRFRLPDIVCFPRPVAGQEMGGIEPESRFSLALDLISPDVFPSLSPRSKWATLLLNKDGYSDTWSARTPSWCIWKHSVRAPRMRHVELKKQMGNDAKQRSDHFLSSAHQLFFAASYLPQASSCGWRLRKENCINEKDREERDRDE